MAGSLIESMASGLRPDEYTDNYREALQEVIEAKVAGTEVVAPAEEPAPSGQVVDLMEALRRSVAEAKERRAGGVGLGEHVEATSAKKSASQDREGAGEEGRRQEDGSEEDRHEEGRSQEDGHPSVGLTAPHGAAVPLTGPWRLLGIPVRQAALW